MTLQAEIDEKSKDIKTEQYPMSIGELASIYREGELDIHPDFQRMDIWTNEQKSNLIESILLGIPLPQIFVSQNKSGVWDVIDGLQRLSTIFQFMGILKDENNKLVKQLVLSRTKFLPSLENVKWSPPKDKDEYDESKFLTNAQRMYIKRAKINMTIIDKSSDPNAKFELFQRLNTGGTPLSPQEVRNCLLIMINKPFYEKLFALSKNTDFELCTPVTDNLSSRQYRLELIVRYLIARNENILPFDTNDLIIYMTNSIQSLATNDDYIKTVLPQDIKDFNKAFRYLASTLNENSFRKFNPTNARNEGPFLISAFEAILIGISKLDETALSDSSDIIIGKIKSIYSNKKYTDQQKRGVRSMQRFIRLTKLSLEVFTNAKTID